MAKLDELISDGALQTAKFGIADTIGMTSLVFRSPALRYCMHLLAFRRDRDSVIIGTRHKASALDATLINGTASHTLTLMILAIFWRSSIGPIVPALLAIAQNEFLSGLEFVNAYVNSLEADIVWQTLNSIMTKGGIQHPH